ncbi:MAG: hypothetical protein JRI68_07125, partial [Deltaproteobacteria bacterium]|nr:hypothetical protein [Deltaproteobacteria bacterium]
MCLSSIAIDLMIGGRFKVAKTLANVGQSYARLGDLEHGLAYLKRARDAHDRYQDQEARIDTALVTACALIEGGRMDEAKELRDDAAALAKISDNVYDKTHLLIVQALIAHHEGEEIAASAHAAEARQLAEGQALVSYHVYATAIEAAARVNSGDTQSGVLLATTALGAVEGMEGSEYGIEVRSLCADAVISAVSNERLATASPTMTADVCRRALDHVDLIAGYVRDPVRRDQFFKRPPVARIVSHAMRFSATASGLGGTPDASAE